MLPKKRKPTHPGIVLSADFLIPLQLTPRQFADKLGPEWNEVKVESIIKGRENLTDKAAQEFASALGTSPEFWKRLQNLYSEWESTQHRNKKRLP